MTALARPCGHRWDIPAGEAAMLLGSFGYRVLPLETRAKRPNRMLGDRGGVHWATTQLAQLARWFAHDPFANIGVATGEPSGLVVIDLDTKRDDGPDVFWQFLKAHGLSVPWNALARTPSGGWHCWLRWPPAYGRCPERPGILPGVDIKGTGGYVVAPPSWLPASDGAGGTYPVHYSWHRMSCPCSVPVAPPWMAQWVNTAAGSGSSRSGEDIDAEQIMARGAPVGSRNDTLYKLACSRYRKHGTGSALVLDELRQAWQAGDTAGMPWSEVRTIAWSARKFIEKAEATEQLAVAGFLAYLERSLR